MSDIYALIPFIATITNLFLTGIVYFRNVKNPINRSFAYWSLSFVFWTLGAFMAFSASDGNVAWLACKINAMGLVFIPSTFYDFVLSITENREARRKKLCIFGYILSFIFLVLAVFTRAFFSTVVQHPWGWLPEIGLAGLFYLPFLLFNSYSGLYLLWKGRRSAAGIKHNQLSYVFIGAVFVYLGGTINIFTVTGYIFYPIGFLFNVLYTGTIAYAILAYRLMDIAIVVRRVLSYAILLTIMIGVYLTGGFLYRQYIGPTMSPSVAVLMMIGATGFTILMLFTLREKLERGMGNLLFPGRYDYQQMLQSLGRTFVTTVNFDELIDSVVRDVGEAIGTEKGSLMLQDKEKKEFFVRGIMGMPPQAVKDIRFKKDDEIIRFLSTDRILLREEIGRNPELNKIAQNQKDYREKLESMGAYISIPIMFRGELKGILNLERKISGRIYTREDFRLLSILASELAIAMENARLFKEEIEMMEQLEKSQNQLVETEKMVLVGQLSAGIAHEIRNPLTSLMGRLQILQSGANMDSKMKEDLEVIDNQAKRISKITENLLSFSKPSSERKELNINDIVEQVLNLLKYEISVGSIKVTKVLSPLLHKIYGNPTLLQQMIVNLIHNAIEAMSGKGELTIMTKNADGGKEIEVIVGDAGVGIPPENLSKIFNPFFTTKSSGAGLGLFIVYNIVRTHNGRTSIDSKPGVGTIFTINIPTISRKEENLQ